MCSFRYGCSHHARGPRRDNKDRLAHSLYRHLSLSTWPEHIAKTCMTIFPRRLCHRGREMLRSAGKRQQWKTGSRLVSQSSCQNQCRAGGGTGPPTVLILGGGFDRAGQAEGSAQKQVGPSLVNQQRQPVWASKVALMIKTHCQQGMKRTRSDPAREDPWRVQTHCSVLP